MSQKSNMQAKLPQIKSKYRQYFYQTLILISMGLFISHQLKTQDVDNNIYINAAYRNSHIQNNYKNAASNQNSQSIQKVQNSAVSNQGSGNSGNSGNNGNSGNQGSGNSGNSGNNGNSGNQGGGNSGNLGNNGNGGGNQGGGNSGNSGNNGNGGNQPTRINLEDKPDTDKNKKKLAKAYSKISIEKIKNTPNKKSIQNKGRSYTVITDLYGIEIENNPDQNEDLSTKDIDSEDELIGEFRGQKILRAKSGIPQNSAAFRRLTADQQNQPNANQNALMENQIPWGIAKFYVLDDQSGKLGVTSGNILVELKEGVDPATIATNYGLKLSKFFANLNVAEYSVTGDTNLLEAADKIKQDATVVESEIMVELETPTVN